MRLKAALEGDLKKHMKREYRRAELAVTLAVGQATDGLKMTMRRQVLSAGLGQRLANTWRDAVYGHLILSHEDLSKGITKSQAEEL